MSLTKQDLQDITSIVDSVVNRAVSESEKRTSSQFAELTETVNDLANHLDERLAEQDRHLAEQDIKIDKIYNHVDGIAGHFSDLRDEEAAGAVLLTQANDRIEDHEQRIVQLEKVSA